MVTPQIVEYIKNTLQQGYPEDKIQDALGKKGWAGADITEAFRIARGIPKSTTAVADLSLPKSPQISLQRPAMPILEKPASRAQQFSPPAATPSSPLSLNQVSALPARPTLPTPLPVSRPSANVLPASPVTTTSSAPTAELSKTAPANLPMQPIISPSPQIPFSRSPQLSGVSATTTTMSPLASSGLPKPSVPTHGPTPIPALSQNQFPLQSLSKSTISPTPEFLRTPGTAKPTTQIPVTGQIPPTSSGGAVIPPSSVEGADTAETSGKSLEQKKSKKTWLYIAVGLVLMCAVYVFAGIKYGIYAFGYNLFPFEGVVETLSKIPTPSPTPPLISTPLPAASSLDPQVNGRTLSFFGAQNEAGNLADLSYDPEGKKVAYILLSDSPNLWLLDIPSGSKSNLVRTEQVNFPTDTTPALVVWAPDSLHVAVVAKDVNNLTDLYIVNVDAKTTVRITQAVSLADTVSTDPHLRPRWNAASDALLVYAGSDLWKISLDGQERTHITAGLPLGSFTWSHDNAKITYTIRRSNEEKVWIMDADGKNFRTLTPSGVNQLPRFSRDDATVQYVSRDATGKQDGLWRIGVDGSGPRQIVGAHGAIREFMEATTDERILIVSRNEGGKNSIWLYADSTGLEEVLPAGEYEPMGFAAWSPDGTSLLTAGLSQFLIQFSLIK